MEKKDKFAVKGSFGKWNVYSKEKRVIIVRGVFDVNIERLDKDYVIVKESKDGKMFIIDKDGNKCSDGYDIIEHMTDSTEGFLAINNNEEYIQEYEMDSHGVITYVRKRETIFTL